MPHTLHVSKRAVFLSILFLSTQSICNGDIFEKLFPPACNGWNVKYCNDFYNTEESLIKNTTLPKLTQESHVLPVQIDLKEREVKHLGDLLTSLNQMRQQVSESLNSGNQLKEILEKKVIPATTENQKTLINVKSSKSELLIRFINFIKASLHEPKKMTLARLEQVKIEIQKKSKKTNSTSNIDVLLIEKENLEKYLAFVSQFENEKGFSESIGNPSFLMMSHTDQQMHALIQVAKGLKKSLADQEFANSDLILIEIGNELAILFEEVKRLSIAQKINEEKLISISNSISKKSSELNNAHQSIASDKYKLSGLSAQISLWNSRLKNTDLYRYWCNNAPHCKLIPDYNKQGPEDYTRYEMSISPEHHAEGCKSDGTGI